MFPNSLTQEAKDKAVMALMDTRYRLVSATAQEAQHRLAIYAATENLELASEGAQWALDMARATFPDMDPSCPDITALKAHLSGELARRLYNEQLCIDEGLHRLMLTTPGLPTWTERGAEEGESFYLAKAWAVAEVLEIDLADFAAKAYAEGV